MWLHGCINLLLQLERQPASIHRNWCWLNSILEKSVVPFVFCSQKANSLSSNCILLWIIHTWCLRVFRTLFSRGYPFIYGQYFSKWRELRQTLWKGNTFTKGLLFQQAWICQCYNGDVAVYMQAMWNWFFQKAYLILPCTLDLLLTE